MHGNTVIVDRLLIRNATDVNLLAILYYFVFNTVFKLLFFIQF